MPFVRRAFIAVLMTIGCASATVAKAADKGNFSAQGIDIWEKVGGDGAAATFRSPDKSWKITFGGQDDSLPVHVRGRLGTLDFTTPDMVAGELVWAPDSSAAFFTGSDGGAVGDHHVHVIYRRGGHLVQTDLAPLIAATFGTPVKCFSPGPANVGGVTWLGKDRLLVAAEVQPDSNCDAMGTFMAYEVDLTSLKVVRTHSQSQARRRFWSVLGAELRTADDTCERRPRDCEIPQLLGRPK